MNSLYFPVFEENKCNRFISCVTFLSVRYFKLLVIHQFGELDSLKTTKKIKIYEISTTLIGFDCLLHVCMSIYIISSEETILVTRFL